MRGKAHRIAGMVGLALVGAALLAGGAQAAERPDDRAGMLGVGAAQVVATPDAFERAALRSIEAASPDAFERAVLREQTHIVVRPDDRAGSRGPGSVPSIPPVAGSPSAGSFHWDDALFGAACLFGVLALGAAATFTLRHRGRMALH